MDALTFHVLSDAALTALVAVLGFLVRYLRAHTSAQTLETAAHGVTVATELARVAVGAVEQTHAGASLKQRSVEKYLAALEHAKTLATTHGLALSDEQWHALIEAAVHDLKVTGAELTAAPVGAAS